MLPAMRRNQEMVDSGFPTWTQVTPNNGSKFIETVGIVDTIIFN